MNQEIYSAIRRKELDISMFTFIFMTPPKKETIEYLRANDNLYEKFSKYRNLKDLKLGTCKKIKMRENEYSGLALIKYLLRNFNQHYGYQNDFKFSLVLASINMTL